MNKLFTFDEVIEMANNPHLLLGNGFSIAYDKDRFSFTTLLESAVKQGIIKKDSEIYKIFENLATADFESIMRILYDSEKVMEVYTPKSKARKRIKKDVKKLREYLVLIITNNHPEKSTVITDEEKKACNSFLGNFKGKKIYTINYDLLMYWVMVSDITDKFKDGFGDDEFTEGEPYVVYGNARSFDVCYLHGGLHLYDTGDQIIKITYNNSEVSLMDQIRENLEKNNYPIFVSEGNSKQKMTKIMHSTYLGHCYKSLKFIGGDIVILGTYLKKNDEHILDAIIFSNVKNIYIGVSSIKNVSHFSKRIDEYNTKVSQKKKKFLYYYDYKSVNIWGR